jgi:hypothetical protein
MLGPAHAEERALANPLGTADSIARTPSAAITQLCFSWASLLNPIKRGGTTDP